MWAVGRGCCAAELAEIFLSVNDVEVLVSAPLTVHVDPLTIMWPTAHPVVNAVVGNSSVSSDLAAELAAWDGDSAAEGAEQPSDLISFESDGCGSATTPGSTSAEPVDATFDPANVDWIKARQGKGGLRCKRKGRYVQSARTYTHTCRCRSGNARSA